MKFTDSRVPRPFRLLSAVVLMLALLLTVSRALSAAAQSDEGFVDDNTYESLFGFSLTWDDPWEVDMNGSGYFPEYLGDTLYFVSDNPEESLSVFSSPAVGSLASNLDYLVEYYGQVFTESELIELEADKRDSHAIIRFDSEGVPYGGYIRMFLTEDLAADIEVILLGELETFDTLIESVQGSIEIGGEPLLGDVDEAEVLDLLEEGESIPFPAPSGLPDDDEEDSEEEDSSDSDDKKLPDEEDAEDEPAPTEEPDQDEPAPTEDSGEDEDEPAPTEESKDEDASLEDLGLIGTGEYESPQYGSTVDWSADWEVAEDMLESDTAGEIDRMALDSAEFESRLFVSFFDATAVGPADWVTGLKNNVESNDLEVEFIEETITDEDAFIFYSQEIDGEVEFGLIEVRADSTGDVTLVVEIIGTEADLGAAFESAQDEVRVDSDTPFTTITEVPEIP
jgi:hypothetical protein